MGKYNITQKLISLILAVAFISGMSFTVCAAADIGDNIIAAVTDGGKITTKSVSFSANTVTVTGTSELPEGETITYVVYKKDELNKASKSNLVKIGETKVKSDSAFSIPIGLKTQDMFETLILEMKAATQSEKAKVEFTAEDDTTALAVKISEIERLISECENRGISTDYERVKYAAAKKVLKMLPVFTANGETASYDYNLETAYKLCAEAKTALESYLNNTAQPKAVVRTAADTPTVQGNSFYSDATKKNEFYVGYSHWEQSDMDMYKDLGINMFQYEIGPKNLLKKAAPVDGWDLSEVHSNKITYLIEYSEENSGSVKIPVSSGSGQLWLSQTVSVKPNTTYTYGVDFKCASASSLRVRLGSKDKWFYDSKNDGEIKNWKSASASYTTAADETELTFSIILHNNSSKLFFDNAFVKDSAGNNLLKNGNFAVENTEMYTVNTAAAEKVKSVFKQAEDNGINITLLTAMHYFPDYAYTYDPTIANGDVTKFLTFMPFNPTHPEVIKVMERFLEELIPLVKDSKALHSITLSNEPQFTVNVNRDYYLGSYHAMLKEKYSTVAEMNKAYGGTSYADFAEVSMPSNTDRRSSERQKLAYFNDYRLFNESIITEYHKAIYDKINSLAPDILLHTKGMSAMNAIGTSGNRIQLGVNNEELSKFLDLNGCDDWAYYGDQKDTLMGKTMWYDYMTSVKNAPVVNSEDHILKDSSTLSRSGAELKMNMADVWQGAVHGRGASVLWLYDNSDRSKNNTGYYNANLTRRADYLAGIGKTTLDLNRLSGEISAISNKAARVAILYSDSSLVLNPYALNASYVAYQQAMFNGEKVFFVNETNPQSLNQNDIDLLIVPCSNYMKAETLAEIKKHIDDGGRVLLLNANNKSWLNENGGEHDAALLNSVTSRSETVSFSSASDMYTYDSGSAVVNKLKSELEKLSHPVSVSGTNTEWLSAEYDGGYVINLCNYGTSSTEISLTAQSGYDIENAYDMISGEKVGKSFSLSPNEPKLLKIEKVNGFKFYSIDENCTKTEISDLKSRRMSVTAKYTDAKPNDGYIHIVSVSENGKLKRIFTQKGNADADGIINSEMEFTVDDGIDLSKCTVKTFLFDGFDKIIPYMPAREIKVR